MHNKTAIPICVAALLAAFACTSIANADFKLLKTHCGKCHLSEEPEGDFSLRSLGSAPNNECADFWIESLKAVKAGEMPPQEESKLTKADRQRIVKFLDASIREYERSEPKSLRVQPRRLNNRELNRSVADVLMIEDVGTHHPTGNLIGDTIHEGFDTHGDSLGMSEFHLEQYIEAFRKVLNGTLLSGDRPESQTYRISAPEMRMTSISQRNRENNKDVDREFMDFRDIRLRIYFSKFHTVPTTGRYRIKFRATGMDRNYYSQKETGHYRDDPIRLSVHLGDRVRTFEMPDEEIAEFELDEWVAAGTKLEFSYPTDALRLRGNGNFKFQYRIGGEYIQKHDPKRYQKVVDSVGKSRRKKAASHWTHWVNQWRGPRPALFSAEIEGPFYDSWPPKRQLALLSDTPTVAKANEILKPIAQRAWRRDVRDGELNPIVSLVQSRAESLGDLEALKEGIVAILVSPSFLLTNTDQQTQQERFASKFSYFLRSTTPSQEIVAATRSAALDDFAGVRSEVARHFEQRKADEFLKEFPHAWLQLDRISFMAPDPVQFPLYDRKRLADDMIAEVLTFFRHAIDNNVPVPELLTADYSFVNADLAKAYDIPGVPSDSVLRKHTFAAGRRGGLLGMGAFLTLTADSLGTSPIHRAVYVMENFLGTKPTPPPPSVKITEPDVRQAKTIKEVLAAHTADASCASCHQTIDPYGYAFENFGPMGGWRDKYPDRSAEKRNEKAASIAVDASATFRNGASYQDITEFRKLMRSDSVRDRFVRCFITKLLTYANGVEPKDYTEVENILKKSAENEYRIVDTIAAVIDSPLFRESR